MWCFVVKSDLALAHCFRCSNLCVVCVWVMNKLLVQVGPFVVSSLDAAKVPGGTYTVLSFHGAKDCMMLLLDAGWCSEIVIMASERLEFIWWFHFLCLNRRELLHSLCFSGQISLLWLFSVIVVYVFFSEVFFLCFVFLFCVSVLFIYFLPLFFFVFSPCVVVCY